MTRSALLLPLLLLPSPDLEAAITPQRGNPEKEQVAEARKQINLHTEEGIFQANEICMRLQNEEATALLLEVLDWTGNYGLSAAHYRDVAWAGLTQIESREAREAVVEALKAARKNPLARMWLARLVGLWGEAELAENLEKLLGDRDVGVKREAAQAMGRLRHVEAARKLERMMKDKDYVVRGNAHEALARIDPEEYREAFLEGLADDEGSVRCALLGAVQELYPEDAEAWSAAALDDEDWRPRLQAIDNLGGTRTLSAVDALIRSVDDPRPLLGRRAVEHLRALTGMKWSKQPQWESWWGENREGFEFPEGKSAAEEEQADPERTEATWNRIPIISDHVLFLVDRSLRMEDRLNEKGKSKAAAAFDELSGALERLEGRLTFNIHAYNEEIEVYSKKPVPLDARSRKKALTFMEDADTGGDKDLWAALVQALEDPEIDTIYLLTSGEPEVGLYVHGNRISEFLAELNRFQKVTVHAVAYSPQGFWHHISQIAAVTGGEFQGFQ